MVLHTAGQLPLRQISQEKESNSQNARAGSAMEIRFIIAFMQPVRPKNVSSYMVSERNPVPSLVVLLHCQIPFS